MAPFIMAARTFPGLLATDLGVHVHPARTGRPSFPALGAYVGGDIVAGVLATGMERDKRLRLFIDVGTNCEIVLGNAERLVSTAAPAGPAFEAAQIRCGMRAADGAIEVVRSRRARLELQVIGDVSRWACAARAWSTRSPSWWRCGLLDTSGRFVTDEDAHAAARRRSSDAPDDAGRRARLRARLARRARTPRRAVYLSQRDVRELQFAKAAISTGWRCCSRSSACGVGRVAGAAGRLVRDVPVAGERGPHRPGAEAAGAADRQRRQRGRRGRQDGAAVRRSEPARRALLDEVEYVELSDRSDFNDLFVEELAFPHDATGYAVVACGALAQHVAGDRAPARLGGRRAPAAPVAAQPSGATSPGRRDARRTAARRLRERVAVAYADCGSTGALDEVCERWGRAARRPLLRRVRRGPSAQRRCADEPGTYVLTDYLVRSFGRSVLVELGLDRYPELRDDYFRHYRRVVWLAQRPPPTSCRAGAGRRRRHRPAAGGRRHRRGRSRARSWSGRWEPAPMADAVITRAALCLRSARGCGWSSDGPAGRARRACAAPSGVCSDDLNAFMARSRCGARPCSGTRARAWSRRSARG